MTDDHVFSVCAVVVSYRPEPPALLALLAAVAEQVSAVVLVHNAANDDLTDLRRYLPAAQVVLWQPTNIGLAAAQNLGIDWARRHGHTYVLLLDQDSVPEAGMVRTLLATWLRLQASGQIAAVGPRFFDTREQRAAPFVRVGFPLSRKLVCSDADQTPACDFLISSGALIPLAVMDRVGPMDAELFIDNVDLEWCFRARALGFTLHGVCAASMRHHLGDARRSLPLGLGSVVVHGPVRLYYMMRNRLRLYRMAHTPVVWIAQDVPRVLVKLVLFGVLIGPRGRNLRFMLRGLWDGLRGRGGACPMR